MFLRFKNIVLIIFLLSPAHTFSINFSDFLCLNHKKDSLKNCKTLVFGHGGMGISSTYPMNSYESISKCLSLGADGTEIDVQITKDSVLVAFHDKFLEESTSFTGTINSYNWSDIENAKYTKTPFLNYSLASLDHIFGNVPNIQDFIFTFDCKLYNSDNDSQEYQNIFVRAINKLIDKYNLDNNIFIESSDENFLKLLKKSGCSYKLFIYAPFDEGLEIAKNNNLDGITISIKNITKQQIEEAHQNNLLIATWNTHSRKRNQNAILSNSDFIQTDMLRYLLNLLEKN